MQYIKISNRGSLNRKYLELTGFGTKRGSVDDATVIGNKGSGTKLAAVAALRLGLELAIASTDCYGTYFLTFDIEEVDVDGATARQIHRCYENRRGKKIERFRYPSEMVIEAFQDWDQSIGSDDKSQFKVLREFICNAFDADKGFALDVVESREHVAPGTTAIYLAYTQEIYDMLFDPAIAPRYFKIRNAEKPVFAMPQLGSIYPKSEPAKSRLFVLGVLVDCTDGSWRKSIFDYSMNAKTLISEERIIKNINEYKNEIAKLYGQLTHGPVAKNVVASVAAGKADFEASVLSRITAVTPASKQVWLDAVHAELGDKIAVASGDKTIDEDCVQIFGYKTVASSSDNFATFLKKLGVPEAKDIVPVKLKYSTVSYFALDAGSQARFKEAFRLFAAHFPERASMPIVFYHPEDEQMRKYAGFTPANGDRRFQDIWLAALTPTSLGPVHDVFQTLVHESRHCLTKAGDYEREFVNHADLDIAHIVFRGEGLAAFEDGTLIPAADGPAPAPNLVMPDEIVDTTRVAGSEAAGEIPVDLDALSAWLEEPSKE